MKKLLTVLVVIIACASFSSCQKEANHVENTNNSFFLKEIEYKYTESIKVYDESEEFHISFLVESNNYEEFARQVNFLKDSRLELLYSKPDNIAKISNENINHDVTECPEIDKSLITSISVQELFIGNAVGYTLTVKKSQKYTLQEHTYSIGPNLTMSCEESVTGRKLEWVVVHNHSTPYNKTAYITFLGKEYDTGEMSGSTNFIYPNTSIAYDKGYKSFDMIILSWPYNSKLPYNLFVTIALYFE